MDQVLSRGNPTYLAIRYSLEFVVVVLGITVSFWLSEWNSLRSAMEHQVKDAKDLLQDLESDEARLIEVGTAAEIGTDLSLIHI